MMRSKFGAVIEWTIVLSFLFLSCSQRITKDVSNDTIIVFPPPPDTARIQFLTSLSTSIDVTGERSAFMTFILGEEKVEKITKPYGLAIHNGKIYICDSMLGGLEIIDLQEGTFEYFRPVGMGRLRKPLNCFVDVDGRLYVADVERRQVVVFDSTGKYHSSLGDARSIKPTDVSVYDNKIWISDITSQKIRVYDKHTNTLLYSFPDASPQSPAFLYSPTNLYVIDDKVYVSDFGDFRIKVYTKEGVFLKSVGSYGKSPGQFVRPKGVAVDNDLNLYVVDAGFENVQIFDREGRLLMFLGGSYKEPGDMWLPAKVVVDYDNLEYFQKYVHQSFRLKHLILVTNQYGPDKINVYGFVEQKY